MEIPFKAGEARKLSAESGPRLYREVEAAAEKLLPEIVRSLRVHAERGETWDVFVLEGDNHARIGGMLADCLRHAGYKVKSDGNEQGTIVHVSW